MSARRSKAGYTLIEVMMGVALSMVGMIGITAMQTASVRSNQDAYETMTASNFARVWLERVKRDSILWSALVPNPNIFFAARANATGSYFSPTGLWAPPQPLAGSPESSSANYHGVELGSLDPHSGAVVRPPDIYYCLHLRFGPVLQIDPTGSPVAMRADARVYWGRKASANDSNFSAMAPAQAGAAGCDAAPAVYQDTSIRPLRVYYLQTVVRWVRPFP